MSDKYVTIFNILQARFYIAKGAKLINIKVNQRTNKAYCIFLRSEHEALFGEWINRDRNLKF